VSPFIGSVAASVIDVPAGIVTTDASGTTT
jgi:hypothetical protein